MVPISLFPPDGLHWYVKGFNPVPATIVALPSQELKQDSGITLITERLRPTEVIDKVSIVIQPIASVTVTV